MAVSRKKTTARRALFHLLWQQPLWSIPFALFFGTIFGSGGWSSYWRAYKTSLVFAYTIGLAVWVTEGWVVGPRRGGEGLPRRIPLWAEILTFIGASLLASYLASVIAHFTVNPGMLGDAKSILITGMFAMLFSLLVTGIIYVIIFYQQAIERARSDQELAMARRIQRGFLLTQFPSMPRLQVHAANVSSREVSGDFYDVVPDGDRGFLLAIADVSGKGVPAALLGSMIQASLRTQAHMATPVAAILDNINALIRGTASHGQFATFFLARMDESTLRLTYSNAGHNHPIVVRRDGSTLDLDRGGTVLGIMDRVTFEEDTISLGPGDRVVLYTDGITEADDGSGELFGEQRVLDLLHSLPRDLSSEQVVEQVLNGARAFAADEEPGDDMTVLALRVLE